jgi:hypothetical protein
MFLFAEPPHCYVWCEWDWELGVVASFDLSYARDIPKVIKRAGRGAFDPVIEPKSGLVLGLLEASPAEDITILSGLPASRDIGRSFKSYLTRTPMGLDGIYAIKLEPESTQGPSKSAFRLTSEAVQPIFSEGKFNEPSWNFRFEAASDFGEASFSLKGYLLRFPDEKAWQARRVAESQEINVPISHPRFKLEARPKTITLEYWKVIVVPIVVALIAAAAPLIALLREILKQGKLRWLERLSVRNAAKMRRRKTAH